jgi:hypothetical protein
VNDSTRRKLKYPDLYGTSACPGSGIRHSTPRLGKYLLSRGSWLRSDRAAKAYQRAIEDKLRREMHAERPGSAR